MMFISRAIVAVVALSVCAYALPAGNNSEVFEIDERATLATVYTTCVTANQVALTFDDGPYIYHRQIVDTLSNAGVKGTFFLNGNNYQCIYDSARVSDIKYAVSKGHELAQHTWSHPELPSLSISQIRTEFSKINTALKKITGLTPAFMRPPYGDYNNNVRQVAAEYGQSVVLWNYDSGDSVGVSIAGQKKVYSDFSSKKGRKAIFLNHEVYKNTATTLLPYAISELKKGGYKMVTLSQCLGKPAYISQVKAGTRDSSWHC